jgi:hypothetical protein
MSELTNGDVSANHRRAETQKNPLKAYNEI